MTDHRPRRSGATLLVLDEAERAHPQALAVQHWPGPVLRYVAPPHGSAVAGGFVTPEACLLAISRLLPAASELVVMSGGSTRFLALLLGAVHSARVRALVFTHNGPEGRSTESAPALWRDGNGVEQDVRPAAWTHCLWTAVGAGNVTVWRGPDHPATFAGREIHRLLDPAQAAGILQFDTEATRPLNSPSL